MTDMTPISPAPAAPVPTSQPHGPLPATRPRVPGLMPVTVNLPPALIADLRLMAEERGEDPGDMIRILLLREVARRARLMEQAEAMETRNARLHALLTADVEASASWADLALRLGRMGFGLRLAGGAPMLEDVANGRRIALSDIGFGYAALARRFGRPMPRQPHRVAQERAKKAAETIPGGPFDIVDGERISGGGFSGSVA